MPTIDFHNLTPGRLIWATINDPNGVNKKSRPVVIVGGPYSDVNTGELFYKAIAGSREVPPDDLRPLTVYLDGKLPEGHPRTGLKEKAFFYADWMSDVYEDQFRGHLKQMPEHILIELLDIIYAIGIDIPPS